MLAGRARVDRIYATPPSQRESVLLCELERVVRLRLDVDADHVEPGAVVAHGRAAGAAEQVEQPRHSYPSSNPTGSYGQPELKFERPFLRWHRSRQQLQDEKVLVLRPTDRLEPSATETAARVALASDLSLVDEREHPADGRLDEPGDARGDSLGDQFARKMFALVAEESADPAVAVAVFGEMSKRPVRYPGSVCLKGA